MTKKQFTVLLCSLALGLSALSSVSVAETILKQREVGQVTLQSRIDPLLKSKIMKYHDSKTVPIPTDTLEELVGNSVDIEIYDANDVFNGGEQDGFSYVIYENTESSDPGLNGKAKVPRITFETTELTHSSKADSAIELVLNASLDSDYLHLSQGAKTIEEDTTGTNANITIDNRAATLDVNNAAKVQVTLSEKDYSPNNENAYLYIPISVTLTQPIEPAAAGDYEATITITEEVLEI